jgi:hypothetical protein
MRTHNTPRLCAGPQTAGTPIKFWNVASIGDDEGCGLTSALMHRVARVFH